MNTLQKTAQELVDRIADLGASPLDWAEYTALEKALADEQAQPANSRIASLYEELRKATDGGSESMTHDDALKQIEYWQDKEQAQGVEPYGWMVQGLRQVERGEFAEANAKSDAKRIGGTCEAFPVFTRPAPPASERDHVAHNINMVGERAELIARLRGQCSNDEAHALLETASEMLEDDAQEKEYLKSVCRQEARAVDEDGQTLNALRTEIEALKAQQVAAPAGYALVPIEPTQEMIAAGRDAPVSAALEDIDADYCAVYKAMLAAAQGAKP